MTCYAAEDRGCGVCKPDRPAVTALGSALGDPACGNPGRAPSGGRQLTIRWGGPGLRGMQTLSPRGDNLGDNLQSDL